MLQIDLTSDIDRAMSEVDSFFRTQIPFGTSRALNDTIFDVRKRIVGSTYPEAFTVRNRAFPGRLFRVIPKATKTRLETILTTTLDRTFIERHVMGGTKRGKSGGRVAIPTNPEKMRSSNGRIRAPMKPLRIGTRKDVFTIDQGNRKLILKRGRKGADNELLYVIVPEANIRKRFRFYEDAEKTALRVFSGHWNTNMNKAIRTSRFS